MATQRSGVITMNGSAQSLDTLIGELGLGSVFYLAADSGNSASMYIGNNGNDTVSTTTGLELSPDGVVGLEINLAKMPGLYVNGTASDKLRWLVKS